MKIKGKNKNADNIYDIYLHGKFRRKVIVYLILTTTILLAITAQALVFLYDGLLSDVSDAVLKSKIQKYCIIQTIVSPCMIILQTIIYKLSSRSQRTLKLFRLFRVLLQLSYVEIFLEITVIPLANMGSAPDVAMTLALFIELLFLCLAYMVFESSSLNGVIPFAYANIMFIARCRLINMGVMVPYIIAAVAIAFGFLKNHQIERKLFDEFYSLRHDGEIYQTFLNLLPEGVAILTEEQQLTYINSSINRILDCSEDDILSRLLDLGNSDVVEEDKKTPKDKLKNEFQKASLKKKDDAAAEIIADPEKKNLSAGISLQSDAAISIAESHQRQEQSKNMKIDDPKIEQYLDSSKMSLSRAKTYDIPKNKRNFDSSYRLKAANTLQVPDALQGGENLQLIMEREKSEGAEVMMRSSRSNNPNQGENPHLGIPHANDDETEHHTEDNKNSGNLSPFLPIREQNSFTKKSHYKLEKKFTPEISFVGPIHGGHHASLQLGGGAFRSASILMSQQSQYKVQASQYPSDHSELSPKVFNSFKGSAENIGAQKTDLVHQISSENKHIESDRQQLKTSSVFTIGNTNVTKKIEDYKSSAQIFKSSQRSVSRAQGKTFAKEKEISEGPKKLTSYVTKLKDMRSTYQSIMRRLKEDMKAFEEMQQISEKKNWSLVRIFRYLKGSLRCQKRQDINSSYISKRNNDEEFRFNLEEENYCIIINSKLKTKASVERTLEINITPTILNHTPYVLVLVKDTTERDLVNRLKETNNYKNTIMASMSHELRTPLNCIIAMQDMLRQNVSEELAAKYLNPAINSSKLLLSLVNDILDFGQIRAGMHQHYYDTFCLKDVLQEALTLFEIPAQNRNLALKLEYDENIPSQIYSDPSRIRQIVINLLNNAIKFTYKGSIKLKAVYKGSQRICIMVNDTGLGIKAEEIKKIFQAFGKMENDQLNPQGVGLGLTISQSLAHRLGPKDARGIKVISEYSKGSCFYFTIKNRANSRKAQNEAKQKVEVPIAGNREELIIRSQTRQEAEKDMDINKDKEETKMERSLCEVNEASGEETGEVGYKLKLLNTLTRIKKPNMPSELKESLRSDPSANRQSQDSYDSDISSTSNPDFHVEITRVHQQRVIDTIALQMKDNQIPMDMIISKAFQPKISISIHPPDEDSLVLGNKTPSNSRQKSPHPTNNLTNLERFLVHSDSEKLPVSISPTNQSVKTSNMYANLTREQKTCLCENVLIVDDNDFNLLALKQILESLQFRVATAYNGEIAINVVKQKAKSSCCKSFTIVFMDCDMPVKDGFETTKELRRLQKKKVIPYFPIIAATSFVNEREINRCFESGMDEYLNKPVNKNKIQGVIKNWCKK